MRIQLFSDLHLERYPAFQPLIAPDTDVVVLAGDIGSYQPGSRLDGTDFGLGRFSPRAAARPSGAGQPRVLFVPGNHEYDGLEFDDTNARLRSEVQVFDARGTAFGCGPIARIPLPRRVPHGFHATYVSDAVMRRWP